MYKIQNNIYLFICTKINSNLMTWQGRN